jgi:phage terminase small subunit
MRIYRVNGVKHKVYDSDDKLPDGLIVQPNWRDANVDDWVKADDDCVIQILRKGYMKRAKGKNRTVAYLGTCTGTFACWPNNKMDTSRRINIYSFGGNRLSDDAVIDRTHLTKHERIFVQYLAGGMNPTQAYLKAFPTNDPGYANMKAAVLTKTDRIRTAMKEELKPVLAELDLDERYVLENIKKVIQSTVKDDTKLKALFKLADIMDLEDKSRTQVTQLSGAVFQGFSEDMIEDVTRPREIECETVTTKEKDRL